MGSEESASRRGRPGGGKGFSLRSRARVCPSCRVKFAARALVAHDPAEPTGWKAAGDAYGYISRFGKPSREGVEAWLAKILAEERAEARVLVGEIARLREELARRPQMTDARANDIAQEEIQAGESGIRLLGEHVFWKQDPRAWAAVFRVALARVIRRSHGMPY